MYFVALTVALSLSYFILHILFNLFFQGEFVAIPARAPRSVLYIAILSVIAYAISFSISNVELSNRVLHAFGGGFVSFFVCYRVVNDAKTPITKFQFFIFSALVVIAMGVANEILEFFLQNYSHFVFSRNPNDTWLDLISNTIGVLIGGFALTPFLRK